jgi:hypothetical protein
MLQNNILLSITYCGIPSLRAPPFNNTYLTQLHAPLGKESGKQSYESSPDDKNRNQAVKNATNIFI